MVDTLRQMLDSVFDDVAPEKYKLAAAWLAWTLDKGRRGEIVRIDPPTMSRETGLAFSTCEILIKDWRDRDVLAHFGMVQVDDKDDDDDNTPWIDPELASMRKSMTGEA